MTSRPSMRRRALLGRPAPESAAHFPGTPRTSQGRRSILPRAASGAGGAGLLPQKVLRTFWGPQRDGPAGAGAGEGRAA